MGNNAAYHIFIKPGFESFRGDLILATEHFLALNQNKDQADKLPLNVVYGGDGTLISALEKNGYQGSYLSVKSPNSLGYFAEFSSLEEFKKFNDEYEPQSETHHLLKVSAGEKSFLAANEFIFSNPYSTMKFAVYINSTLLCYCASSGICISTPFGSTGYNHSLGGSILLSSRGYEYNIMAPIENNIYHNSLKSICLNENDKMKIVMKNQVDVTLASDMKVIDFGKEVNEYEIEKTDCGFSMLHVDKNSIYKRLRMSFAMDKIKL